MGDVMCAEVNNEPIVVAEHEDSVRRSQSGAVVCFSGVVRSDDSDRNVTGLHYEAHPDATSVIRDIATTIAAIPDVEAVALTHRIGELTVGDVAFCAAVSSAHRREAFEACMRAVDEVKARLPIWKHQFFVDGTDEWVGSP